MYSGFEFNQETKPQTVEHPHKYSFVLNPFNKYFRRLNEAAKPFSVPAEHKRKFLVPK